MIVRIGIGAAALLTAGGAAAQDKAETPLHKAVGAPDELKLSGSSARLPPVRTGF